MVALALQQEPQNYARMNAVEGKRAMVPTRNARRLNQKSNCGPKTLSLSDVLQHPDLPRLVFDFRRLLNAKSR